eukprot:Hpha_TRINITY_DN15029_c5_g20::TRINITY_DN15029_c5_g20_i1::g.125635::m.125635/K03849/ALG8; alpha-1,3-glucosyltransferase
MSGKEIAVAAVVLSGVKLLLVPAYRSTDFEVHRNWLAVTHSLPVEEWYFENTSQWTLDYPPFFAAFEWFLSFPAAYFDPAMLQVSNLEYASFATILFQRLTVIIGDLLLLAATAAYLQQKGHRGIHFWGGLASVVLHPGLVMVDNIHFQYNGFLYGLWILSLLALEHQRPILSGVIFAVVLNLKHIFIYFAPAYFFYLFRRFCIGSGGIAGFLTRITKLGLAVVGVFAVSVAPFAAMGQLQQLAARLFPWGRGLCHAYWAPNFYALYNAADLAAAKVLGVPPTESVNTRGLVDRHVAGAATHAVLPSITPLKAALLTLGAFVATTLLPLSRRPPSKGSTAPRLQSSELCWLCALSAAAFFTFSWHVHEKAVLMVLLPLALLGEKELHPMGEQAVWTLQTVACLSLWPLLFRLEELPIKAGLTLAYAAATRPSAQVQLSVSWLVRLVDITLVALVTVAALIPPLSEHSG